MKKHLLSALLAMCLVTTAFAQQGKVYETRTVKSKILGMERSYSIYLPAGYDEGDGSYPVLYLLHGLGDALDTAHDWKIIPMDVPVWSAMGTFLLIIAEIFRYGIRMKEEQDLTV